MKNFSAFIEAVTVKPRVNGLIYGGDGNAGMGGWVPPQNLEKKTYKTNLILWVFFC